eukprot:gene7325-9981_t
MSEHTVHRLRIGNYIPSAIKCIAAADTLSTTIAVGREDGDIDIYDTSKQFLCFARVAGSEGFQLQSLTWSTQASNSGRLFGVSLRGFLFEIDFVSLKIKNIRDSYGGAIWGMTSSPRSSLLAIACEDGVVRLFLYDSGNSLEYHKSMPSFNSRALCVCFHPVEPLIFSGCGDGSIRCLDEVSGRELYRMTGDLVQSTSTIIWCILVLKNSTIVTGDNKGHLQIWDGVNGVLTDSFRQHAADILTLATTPDENSIFASGIDGKVICIQRSASSLSSTLYNDNTPWLSTYFHRAHSHDVFSLAICYLSNPKNYLSITDMSNEPGKTCLISGGMDTKLFIYSTTDFVTVRPRRISSLPLSRLVSHSNDYHSMIINHQKHIDLWNLSIQILPNVEKSKINSQLITPPLDCRLMIQLHLKGNEFMHCSALSSRGTFIVATTSTSTRLWKIENNNVRKLALPTILTGKNMFCQSLAFSEDETHLVMYFPSKGHIMLFKINYDDDIDFDCESVLSLVHVYDHKSSVQTILNERGIKEDDYRSIMGYSINKMTISNDNKYIIILNTHQIFYIYTTNSTELYWHITDTSKAFTDFSLVTYHDSSVATGNKNASSHKKKNKSNSNSSINQLVCLLSNQQILLFDIENQCLANNNYSTDKATINSLTDVNLNEIISYSSGYNLAIDSKMQLNEKSKIFLYGNNFGMLKPIENNTNNNQVKVVSVIDIHKKDGKFEKILQNQLGVKSHGKLEKQKERLEKQIENIQDYSSTVFTVYQNIIHMGCIDGNLAANCVMLCLLTQENPDKITLSFSREIVVENPWQQIADSLPDTLQRKRYGT